MEPESTSRESATGSESTSGIIGRLLHNAVALIEARADLTRQEMRTALRDVAIALLLLVAALALVLLMVPLAVAVLILVLAQILPAWLATAIVLAVMITSVAVLVLVARLRLRRRRWTFLIGLREDWQAVWRAVREALER